MISVVRFLSPSRQRASIVKILIETKKQQSERKGQPSLDVEEYFNLTNRSLLFAPSNIADWTGKFWFWLLAGLWRKGHRFDLHRSNTEVLLKRIISSDISTQVHLTWFRSGSSSANRLNLPSEVCVREQQIATKIRREFILQTQQWNLTSNWRLFQRDRTVREFKTRLVLVPSRYPM